MKKNYLVIVLVLVFVLSMVLSACTGEEEARVLLTPEPAVKSAVEAGYDVVMNNEVAGAADQLVLGQTLHYPIVSGMENLEKQRKINGQLSTHGPMVASLEDGTKIVKFASYEVTQANEDLLCVRYISDERLGAMDETVIFYFASDILCTSMQIIYGRPIDNDNFEALYNLFVVEQVAQNAAAISLEEFGNCDIAYYGDNTADMEIAFLYYKDGSKYDVRMSNNDTMDYVKENKMGKVDFR